MPKSIAVFGAGPGLGQAVARRYAREGYDVALVARRPAPLDALAKSLAGSGASARAIHADLSDTDAVPRLAERIRSDIGDLDAFYYGPSTGGAMPATALAPRDVEAFMPIALYTLVALVRAFLPRMVEQNEGGILIAAGASAVQGMPNFSGPGPALAAQRNYVQSLHSELSDRGVYVGALYIGATIEHSAWHAKVQADKAAGRPVRTRGPVVNPSDLADRLWDMHQTTREPEAIYPDGLFGAER